MWNVIAFFRCSEHSPFSSKYQLICQWTSLSDHFASSSKVVCWKIFTLIKFFRMTRRFFGSFLSSLCLSTTVLWRWKVYFIFKSIFCFILSLHRLLIKINFNAIKSILFLCARVFIDVKLLKASTRCSNAFQSFFIAWAKLSPGTRAIVKERLLL